MENKSNKVTDLLEKYNVLDKESQLEFRNKINGKSDPTNKSINSKNEHREDVNSKKRMGSYL